MFADHRFTPCSGWALLGAFLVATSSGCFIETSTDEGPLPPVTEPGRLTLRWTVDEATDPNLCIMGRAASIDIVVTTPGGTQLGEFRAPCTAFATTISSLAPGSYAAGATLIDASGRNRTTEVDIRPFTLIARSEVVIDIDFPADSFLDSLHGGNTMPPERAIDANASNHNH